ncbi:MAG TPA: S41 family peptidase [Phycisphaerae bacterium]|nr:S41 family peptidase [Phycisphaerae bacterium]
MPKRNLIWIVAVVAASLVTLLVTRRPPRIEDRVVVEFDPVTEAYRQIREHYLYPVDESELRLEAIASMVANLDEYSSYIPPDRAKAFAQRMKGVVRGLGLKVEVADGHVTVIGPLVNSPAQRAGPVRGDRILQIDGQDVAGLSQRQVERLLDAPKESTVRLLVRRPSGEIETLRCTRGTYRVESVLGLYRQSDGRWAHMIDPNAGIAYVRVREILPDTPEHLRGTFRQLNRIRVLVLDLRGDPGGDLPAAVELCDMLLPDGRIVTLTNRRGESEHRDAQSHGTISREIHVVVLVNGKTASAAEIIAGSLAVHDRAVLVGRRTLGKGCIQSMIPLGGDLGQINLTTAEFFVEPNRPIQRRPDSNTWGVDPHVEVGLPAATQSRLARLRVGAEVLPPSRPATRPATQPAGRDDDPAVELLRLDAQLRRAVALARTPRRIDDILRRAAAARTRPAARADTKP